MKILVATLLLLAAPLALTPVVFAQAPIPAPPGVAARAEDASGGRAFTDDGTGWTFVIPAGWADMDQAKVARLKAGGKAMVEKSGDFLKTDTQRHLVIVQKDKAHNLVARAQPHGAKDREAWKGARERLLARELKTYEASNIPCRNVTVGAEKIDGLEFLVTSFEILHPKTLELLVRQKSYARLIGGQDLTITTTTRDGADEEAIVKAIRASKFAIRE